MLQPELLVLHHLGIASRDIARSAQFVDQAFRVRQRHGPIHDPNLRADMMLLDLEGAPGIEIVSGPAVDNFVQRGTSLYHACYLAEQIESSVANLMKAGGLVVVPPVPAVLFAGRRVAFVQTPIGLIELLEGRR